MTERGDHPRSWRAYARPVSRSSVAILTDAPTRTHAVSAPNHTPLNVGRAVSAAAQQKRNHRIGIVAILVSAIGMGMAGLFGRMATPDGAIMGEFLTFGRMAVGAIGMLAILTFSGRLRAIRQTRLSWPVVLGGVFLGISLATYLSATVLIDLSLAVVLHYLGPVIATLLARFMLKERIATADALSLITSFAGMMLAAGLIGGGASARSSEDQVLGIVLGVISGITYGGALLCYRYRPDMPSDVRSLWNFVFGAVTTAGMLVIARPDLSAMTASNWAWAGALFLICGLVALGMLVVAGKYLRASELSGLSYTEIIVATMLGAAVFGEGLSPMVMLGIGLILVAAVLPLLSPQPVAADGLEAKDMPSEELDEAEATATPAAA
nr:DMT family transporter [Actinomycetales bacterium]